LLREVQASPDELRQGLAAMGAAEIGGVWRVVDGAYFAEVAQLVLGLCIENEWPSAAVPAEDCVTQLPDYCPHVVRHCIAFYSTPIVGNTKRPADEDTWSLDTNKVCAFVASRMLESTQADDDGQEVKQWPEAEFLEEWNDSTPADMTPNVTMLHVRCYLYHAAALLECDPAVSGSSELYPHASRRLHVVVNCAVRCMHNDSCAGCCRQGIACVTQRRGSNGEENRYIYSFPESALPATVAERFTAIFDHRTHWSFEELDPYIRCVSCVRSLRGHCGSND
jgi:sister chromatid cohesion protein DCC1